MISAGLLLLHAICLPLRVGSPGSFPRPLKAEEEREYLERAEREGGTDALLARHRTARRSLLGGGILALVALLLVIGGEKRGISRGLLNSADEIVRIDYARPFRAALSAASAATILGYEVMRQNLK